MPFLEPHDCFGVKSKSSPWKGAEYMSQNVPLGQVYCSELKAS